MTTEPRWIDKAALMLLHAESLAEFGGAPGVRDDGAIDSALARPINIHQYAADRDLPALAAAYAYGIARNHPFIDGNKRMAFLAIGLFLSINGKRFAPDKVEAVRVILDLADGNLPEDKLSDWIRRNTV